MKLKLIALAAMLAAGSAQAKIDTGLEALDGLNAGNGELVFNLKWKDSNTADGNQSASAAFDLGMTMNDAISAFNTAGYSKTWDLSTYGAVYDTFVAAVAAAPEATAGVANIEKAEMSVFALDSNGNVTGNEPGDQRLITTTAGINSTGTKLIQTTSQTPANGQFTGIFGNTTEAYMRFTNLTPEHTNNANGANNADSSSGQAWFDDGAGMDKFGNNSVFDSTNKFFGQYAAGDGVLSGQDKALPFFRLTALDNNPVAKVSMLPFGADLDGDGTIEFDNNEDVAGGLNEYGLWTLQGNTLKYEVAAVPEAETYAMMLAGLGLVGFMARRRMTRV